MGNIIIGVMLDKLRRGWGGRRPSYKIVVPTVRPPQPLLSLEVLQEPWVPSSLPFLNLLLFINPYFPLYLSIFFFFIIHLCGFLVFGFVIVFVFAFHDHYYSVSLCWRLVWTQPWWTKAIVAQFLSPRVSLVAPVPSVQRPSFQNQSFWAFLFGGGKSRPPPPSKWTWVCLFSGGKILGFRLDKKTFWNEGGHKLPYGHLRLIAFQMDVVQPQLQICFDSQLKNHVS